MESLYTIDHRLFFGYFLLYGQQFILNRSENPLISFFGYNLIAAVAVWSDTELGGQPVRQRIGAGSDA